MTIQSKIITNLLNGGGGIKNRGSGSGQNNRHKQNAKVRQKFRSLQKCERLTPVAATVAEAQLRLRDSEDKAAVSSGALGTITVHLMARQGKAALSRDAGLIPSPHSATHFPPGPGDSTTSALCILGLDLGHRYTCRINIHTYKMIK